ncbi:hypothetical protein ACFS07_23870 [Undibacterium arcticum]
MEKSIRRDQLGGAVWRPKVHFFLEATFFQIAETIGLAASLFLLLRDDIAGRNSSKLCAR